MKKILFIALSFIAVFSLDAQSFKKGDVMLSPGIGLGVYGVGFGIGFSVPVILNFDIGVHDYVSVGAYGGFWTRRGITGFGNNNSRLNSIHVGARATFHFWQLIDDKVDANLISDDLDIYFTPWLGYNVRTANWAGNNNFGFGNRFQGGAQIGVRYFVNEHIGFFGEWGGTPTSYANLGMTFKF